MVTRHPLPASVGLDVLKQGVDVVDPTIATHAMLGLVEPLGCGMFVVDWYSKSLKLYGLNTSGCSSYALNRNVIKNPGFDRSHWIDHIPGQCPLALTAGLNFRDVSVSN